MFSVSLHHLTQVFSVSFCHLSPVFSVSLHHQSQVFSVSLHHLPALCQIWSGVTGELCDSFIHSYFTQRFFVWLLAPLHNALSAVRFKWKITAYKYHSEVVLCVSQASTLCVWLLSLIVVCCTVWQPAAVCVTIIICCNRFVLNCLPFGEIGCEPYAFSSDLYGVIFCCDKCVSAALFWIIHCRQSPIWPHCLCMNQARRKRMKLKGWKIKVGGEGWTSAILLLCLKLSTLVLPSTYLFIKKKVTDVLSVVRKMRQSNTYFGSAIFHMIFGVKWKNE